MRSQDYLLIEDHHVITEIVKQAHYAPNNLNNLQKLLKLDKLVPFSQFKSILIDIEPCERRCF